MTPSEILSHDLKGAIAHELGHAIYALSRGCPFVDLRLFLNPNKSINTSVAKTVLGQVIHERLRYKIDRAAMGFAGYLAESMADGGELDDSDLFDTCFQEDALSATDREAVNLVPQHRRWPAFLRASAALQTYSGLLEKWAPGLRAKFLDGGMSPIITRIDRLECS